MKFAALYISYITKLFFKVCFSILTMFCYLFKSTKIWKPNLTIMRNAACQVLNNGNYYDSTIPISNRRLRLG